MAPPPTPVDSSHQQPHTWWRRWWGFAAVQHQQPRTWWRRWWGDRAERLAWRWARKKGWKLVARNASCPLGEIDLVVLDGRTLVVVEVRSRQSGHPDDAARSVNLEKQRRVSRMALWFRKRHGLQALDLRFDVVAIIWPANGTAIIQHHPHAFNLAVPGGMDG